MSGTFDPHWFRVAGLTPRPRAHASVHRHVARGQVWDVLQDNQTGRYFQVSAAANLMLCLMDGRRTMQAIWDIVSARLGAARPTRDEVVRLLVRLHQADLLLTSLPPDMAELARRSEREQAARWRGWFASPLAMRFPLLDPDRFLIAMLPVVRPIFSWPGFACWLALVAVGLVLAIPRWPELTADIADRVFTTYSVVMLLLLYPASKMLHELGHAFATRVRGGEVHEVGIMLLVLYPVPYVEASSASAFPERRHRMLVGAAGIMVELALAAAAMIVWVSVEPGLTRAAAFNLMLLCGVSTLVFNGNPLMRFDGYYVLGDLIGIHNLDQRARRFLVYLLQRFAFGARAVELPARSDGEAKWLAGYGVASFVYRVSVMIGIALLISQRYFALGVILALVSVAQMMLWPVLKGLRSLATGPALRHHRGRAVGVVAGFVAVVALLLTALPMPYAQVTQGVVWVPEEATVTARADGFVARLLTPSGEDVVPGQPLLLLTDPVAQARIAVARAQVAVAESRYDAVNLIDLTQSRLAFEQQARARAALARAEERVRDLTIVARVAGRFVVPDAPRLPGRHARQGDVLGYVIGGADVAVHAVVNQADIDVVRSRTRSVALRFTETVHETVAAETIRETPSALTRPPAAVLAAEGGGPMLLDPASPRRDRPLDTWYEVVIRAGGASMAERIGSRVYVRFDLGSEPVLWRMLRGGRRMLLRVFNV